MRSRLIVSMLGVVAVSSPLLAATAQQQHLNPVIQLLEQQQPVMGLYAPSNRRHGGPEGAPPPPVGPQKSPLELAQETVAYKSSDFVFNGTTEYHFEQTFPEFAIFAGALKEAGPLSAKPFAHLAHPMVAKIPLIAAEPTRYVERIGQELNAGVSGVMFVGVESAAEVKQGLDAMRFKSQGGTRPDSVGVAPAFWGLSDKEYRHKADLWPLNPKGELINWTIVESKEGLKHVREIAAVKGIGVLWPGAGTLREVFSSPGPDGKPVLDQAAWEAAIQQVLAACKEFHVACGFPAGPNDIEMRMKQGFSVFVSQWNDAGFKAVELGRKAGNRPVANE
jgi:2-keto-3-deoxy-L-rhamnonate aldolase RhmA